MAKIVDITDLLKSPVSTSHKYNPAIANVKDDIYIVIWRNTYAYRVPDDQIYNDQSHPWYKAMPWGGNNMLDRSFITFLSIDDCNVRNLVGGSSFPLQVTDEFVTKYNSSKDIIDCRILKLPDGNFILTGNVSLWINGWHVQKIAYSFITVNVLGDGVIEVECSEFKMLCNEISPGTEKNWAAFISNGKLFFNYGLAQQFDIIKDEQCQFLLTNELDRCSRNQYFCDLAKTYKNIDLKISSTTPLINFEDGLIGVGHIKYYYNKINKITDDPLGLKEFEQSLDKVSRHHEYTYLMFFYTIRDFFDTVILGKVSCYFLPSSYSNVCFPSSLFMVEENLVIGYGDRDSKSKLLYLTPENINEFFKEENTNSCFILDKLEPTYKLMQKK